MEAPGGSTSFQKSRRPPGLRGKEIGLYYRELARKRKKEPREESATKINLGPKVSVPPEILRRVHECLEKSIEQEETERISYEFEKHFHHLLSVNFEDFLKEAKSNLERYEDCQYTDKLNDEFKNELLLKTQNKIYLERLKTRERLPAVQHRQEILDSVLKNQVVLVLGSTGCGKTTQVPQLLLEHYIQSGQGSRCRIVCTQPRRISAISVAERVAFERCENLGKSVGYQIRLESIMPRERGSILFCTTGILLQKMHSDPLLGDLNVAILDEIHERSVETDLLMALLKKIMPMRPDLKIILMSATVSENVFRDYFDNCQTTSIEGVLFPVEVFYLEDILQETGYTNFSKTTRIKNQPGKERKQQKTVNQEYAMMIEPYIRQIRSKYDSSVIKCLYCPESEGCTNLQFLEHLIFYICEKKGPGAILVFLPGYDKISKLHNSLENPSFALGKHLQNQLEIYPLHSMMPTINQQNVFLPAPAGKRKVILSTIIAETSVTIDDVVYVINAGRTKISSYNVAANIQTLEEVWITKANSQQRKGRAGRVQPGICYNLFTRAREATLDDAPIPEILRSKLESIILNLKLLHITNVFEFLTTLIDAPDTMSIENGLKLLKRIEALDDQDFLTPLGMHLARLPVDPQMGKMVLMAALFRCLDPITSVAAGVSFKSPFFTPLGQEKKVDRIKREMAEGMRSDHLLINNVISKFRDAREDRMERRFCYDNFLSISIVQQLENMKQQFADLLCAAKFLETSSCVADESNINSGNVTLLRAIIAAGLYPNMAQLHNSRQVKNRVFAVHKMSTPEERRVNFHPSSVNAGELSFDSHYFVYFLKQKSSSIYLLDATMVFPMAFIIFGDHVQAGFAPAPQNLPYISVGHTYNFVCDQTTCELILKLRQRLQWLLQKKALNPSPILPNSGDEQIVNAIQILLSLDDAFDYVPDYDNFRTDSESDTG